MPPPHRVALDAGGMNRLHRWYCRSEHWRRTVADHLIGWTLDGVSLGDDLLELGSGYGAATMHLCRCVRRVTALDIDRPRLRECRDRVHARADSGTGVPDSSLRAVCADGRMLPFASGTFSSVVSVAMLHHVNGPDEQQRLLSEVWRVLRPGGIFAASDAVWTAGLRLFHLGDVFAPVSPEWLDRALRTTGFASVDVSTRGRYLRWRAHRPSLRAS